MINVLKKDSKLKDQIFDDQIFRFDKTAKCCVTSEVLFWTEYAKDHLDGDYQISLRKLCKKKLEEEACQTCKEIYQAYF